MSIGHIHIPKQGKKGRGEGGGRGGMIFKKLFSDFNIYFNVKLIVLPKILHL